MALQILWSIDWLEASTQDINGHSDVVLNAGWRCTGTQENTDTPPTIFTNSIYGICSFSQPPKNEKLTPYELLTQSQVIEWCWSNGVNQEDTETTIKSNLNLQINPPVIKPPLPWENQ